MLSKILKIIYFIALCFAITIRLQAQNFTGSGTAGDPWKIYTKVGLDSMRLKVSASPSRYFELANDIDCGDDTVNSQTFNSGVHYFDGKNFTIKNRTVNYNFIKESTGQLQMKNLVIRNFKVLQPTELTTSLLGMRTLENIKVVACTSYVTRGSTLQYFSFFGWENISGVGFTRVGVDSSAIIMGSPPGDITALNRVKVGFFFADFPSAPSLSEVYVKNSSIIINPVMNASTTNISAGIISGSDAINNFVLEDSYLYNNTIKAPAQTGSSPNYFSAAAPLYGAWDTDVDSVKTTRVYVKSDTISMPTSTYTSTYHTFFINNSVAIGTPTKITFTDSYVGPANYITRDSLYGVLDQNATYDITVIPPERKSDSLMKVQDTYENWDFTDVWGISSKVNGGYPFLRWENPSVLTIRSPLAGDAYYASDNINITWDTLNVDTVNVFYSTNSGFSWNYLGTTTDTFYNWTPLAIDGNAQIKIASLDSVAVDISGSFIIQSIAIIEIWSPLDQTATNQNGTLTVDIEVFTANINQFSLFYAINDTTTWTPISLDIPVSIGADTTTVSWNVPFIYGEIFLLAREISDTVIYNIERGWTGIGRNRTSYPQICWYGHGGVGLQYKWRIDQACGWVSGYQGIWQTAILNDLADGYTTINQPYVDGAYDYPGTFLYTMIDTNYVDINSFYNYNNDTLIYKDRRYWFNPADSTIRADDLINGIDSLLFCDLKPYRTTGSSWVNSSGWVSNPVYMQLYNVQRTKISGNLFPVNYDFESLNDPGFEPVLLVMADNTNGGWGVRTIDLLEEPNPSIYVQDIARMYTQLNYTRDYFRGIDPKARKKNR